MAALGRLQVETEMTHGLVDAVQETIGAGADDKRRADELISTLVWDGHSIAPVIRCRSVARRSVRIAFGCRSGSSSEARGQGPVRGAFCRRRPGLRIQFPGVESHKVLAIGAGQANKLR